MARKSVIPPKSLDEVLDWLNSDRELAGEMYVQLRHDLAKLFQWRGFLDPEELTDEVFDRVSRKVHEVRPTYEGDPRHYFRAVANNVIKEELKKIKTRVSLEGVEDQAQPETQVDDEAANMAECLESCLQDLSSEVRELVLSYYAKEKQAKIDHRSELAQQLGMSVQTLRVKVHRIRAVLDKCIQNCLKRKAQ